MRSLQLFRWLLPLLAMLLLSTTKAQEFYGSDGSANLIRISVAGGSCTSGIIPSCTGFGTFNSIAMGRDTFYGTDPNRFLKRAVFVNGTFSSCVTIGQLTTALSALTIDNTGMLYGAIGTQLYKINPQTAVATLLGTMPYFSAGDLVFYNGSLYMAASTPSPGIIKVNITTPSLSTMYVPMTQTSIIGMVNVAIGCNENRVYALNRLGNNTQIIEINMATASVAGVTCTVPLGITDGASPVESGVFAGINIQNVKVLPECKNRPASASIQVNALSGLTPYTYQLNNTVTNTTGLFTGLTPGNYTIHISAAAGCSRDTTVIITMADTPRLQLQVINSICNNTNGSITVSATSASPFVYSLNGAAGQSSGTFTGLPAGIYALQVTDSNRCISATTATIQSITPPLAQQVTTSPATCGTTNGAITVTSAGPVPTYSINNGPPQSIGQFNNLAAGSYVISTFTTQGCRYDTLVVVRTNNPSILFTVAVTPASCNLGNGAFLVLATNALGYSINSGPQQTTGQFSNLTGGNYVISAFTASGCQKDTTITLPNILHAAPAMQITTSAPDCYDRTNGSILLTTTGAYAPYTYNLNNSTFSSQASFFNLQSATYSLRIKDSGGCITDTTATVPLYVLNRPVVTVTKESPTCLKPSTGSVLLAVSGSGTPYSIRYQNTSYPVNNSVNNLAAGDHLFRIADRYNCIVHSTTVALPFIQLSECDTVYMPNAFTPDRNGTNEVFKATAYGTLLKYTLSVYNRFGQLVFLSTDVNKGWNGTINGLPQPAGAYIWSMSYLFGSRPQRKQQGTVLLIR